MPAAVAAPASRPAAGFLRRLAEWFMSVAYVRVGGAPADAGPSTAEPDESADVLAVLIHPWGTPLVLYRY